MKITTPKAYDGGGETRNVIAPAGLQISAQHIRIGEYLAKTIFVFTYPRNLVGGWFGPIINMPKMMDVSIFISPMDTAAALRKLRKKITEIEAELMDREDKGYVRDPMLETARADIETLRDALQQAREKLFQVGVYITLYGRTKEELKAAEDAVVNQLESQLVYAKPALLQQADGFVSCLPIGNDKLEVTTPLNSGPASSLFPFVSPDLTSDEGIMYGLNLHNNDLIIFDRFSMENANAVIFAKSGSGKSYAAKLEIIRSLMTGTDIIIIDPENEYKSLSDAVGGSYFRISLTSLNRINPFDIPIIPEDEAPEEVFRSHVLNLTGLIKLMLGEVSAEEDAMLDRAIIEAYGSRDITPATFTGDAKMTPPLLGDLRTVLRNTEGGEEMAMRLDKFVSGSYAGFTNAPTNVDMKNRLIVFSIRDLEDQLRPIAMYIILNFVWNLIRAKLKRRVLVIDEAWWMMKYRDSAEFLTRLVKRARKYYLGITTITQDVEDFLQSEQGRPIITNSSIQLLLKQAPASIQLLRETFGLTDYEARFLLEAQVGEGLFFAGAKHIAIKIIPSYTEDQIITTDPEQLLEIKGLK